MTNHICCLGFDPRVNDIAAAFQHSGSVKRTITDFFSAVLESTREIKTFKLNFAFFEQYGLEGMEALNECLTMARSLGKFVIGDVKRGDIDISNQAYIHALTHSFIVDGATFHPLIGLDSFNALKKSDLRPYFLIKTSNPSSKDLQELQLQSTKSPFYLHCIDYLLPTFPEGGFVIGATDPKSISLSLELFSKRRSTPYLLIPGVGRQGGSCKEILSLLKPHYGDQLVEKVIVNVSSAIIYAASSNERSVDIAKGAIAEAANRYINELKV